MKKTYATIVFLLISLALTSAICKSQNWTEVYKDYIPSKMMSDLYSRNQINASVEASAVINPELIYYQLLKYAILDSSVQHYPLYADYLHFIQNDILQRRREWARAILDKISRSYDDRAEANEAREILNEFIEHPAQKETPNPSPWAIDSALIDRMVILYYSKGDLSIFKDSLNVHEQRKLAESNRRNELWTQIHAPDNTFDKDGLIRSLMNSWYLYPAYENPIEAHPESLNFEELLIAAIEKKYSITQTGEFQLLFGFSGPVGQKNYDFIGPEPREAFNVHIPYSSPCFSISCSYKYFLKSSISVFSYLKLRFSYSFLTSTNDLSFGDNSMSTVYQFSLGSSLYDWFVFPSYLIPTTSSFNIFLFQLATPIITYRSFLTIEPLLCYYKSSFSYAITYPYVYERFREISVNNIIIYSRRDTTAYENHEFIDNKFAPGIELDLNVLRNVSTICSIMPGRYQLLLGYAF